MKNVVKARLGRPGVGLPEGNMIQTAVRLSPETMAHVVEVATRRGLATSTVLRSWIDWASREARAERSPT